MSELTNPGSTRPPRRLRRRGRRHRHHLRREGLIMVHIDLGDRCSGVTIHQD